MEKSCGERCCYCRKELDVEQWNSCWDSEYHYKSIICECGKKNWVRLEFDGSGHDFLFKKDVFPLESTVRRVKDR